MATPPGILNKVKLLLKLATSSNPHEADNARKLAEGLIEKHSITEEELESIKDKKPLYGDDELMFSTVGIVSWRQQLALVIAKHFMCQVVQEEMVPTDGEHFFNYFAYGDPEDVKNVKFAFKAFANKVEYLVDTQCLGRGPIYVESYCEGVVDAIKQNILMYGIDIPDKMKKPRQPKPEQNITITGNAIDKPQQEKPKPAERRVDVNSGSMVKDIMAYFKGVEDSKDLFLDDILELAAEVEEPKELSDEAKPGQ